MLELNCWKPTGRLVMLKFCTSSDGKLSYLQNTTLVMNNVSMRIYPHLQDTGGFFVVVFERKGSHKASDSAPAP